MGCSGSPNRLSDSASPKSSPEQAAIRIHLSFGALPPGVSVDQLEIYENFVIVQTTAAELALAVDEWLVELAAFPVR